MGSLLLLFVIFFARHSGESRNPAPSTFSSSSKCRASLALRRAGYFFALPKESNQRSTPARRLDSHRAINCPALREGAAGFARQYIPVHAAQSRRILRRHPAGFSCHASPHARGPRTAASCRRSRARCHCSLGCTSERSSGMQDVVDQGAVSGAEHRGVRRKSPQEVATMDAPRFAEQYTDVLSSEPRSTPRSAGQDRTMRSAPPRPVSSLLWLLFCKAQKVTRSPAGRVKLCT